ncbi:MAG: aspartate kinase [Candidatus Krumholzibacteriia bacterium]
MSPSSPLQPRAVLVRKYGGSSLASVERLNEVARSVRAARDAGHQVVVVVSAMGKTTDELADLARRAHPNPPRRELDMLLSVGERIAMSLLSMALDREGCPAISLTGSQCGIITDSSHNDARILEVKGDRVRDALARGYTVVVAGFQGVSREKEITTLGRGGSDATAVALAAALGAGSCEILKDVDGVLEADPKLVPGARRHDHLSWDQMLEIAAGGCGVVHLRAVEYARAHRVPLVVRSSFHDGPGTTIGDAPADRTVAPIPPDAGPVPGRPAGGPRYRPLVMHLEPLVARLRLTAPRDGLFAAWRDLALALLDPCDIVAEWLDGGPAARWEALVRKGLPGGLTEAMEQAAVGATGDHALDHETGLACITLAGGRPDSWLAVQQHLTGVLGGLGLPAAEIRVEGSTLRLVFRSPPEPGRIARLHQALLGERIPG